MECPKCKTRTILDFKKCSVCGCEINNSSSYSTVKTFNNTQLYQNLNNKKQISFIKPTETKNQEYGKYINLSKNTEISANTFKFQESGRGTLILILGILSFILGPFTGMPAWIMGQSDLKKIKNGIIALNEKTNTEIGMILGIICTSISAIVLFSIAVVLITASSAYTNHPDGELLLILFIGVGLLIIPGVFYCLTLQNALKKVKENNRTINPGEVWLLWVPLFNIVWQFILVSKVASSLHNEFESRNIKEDLEPGKAIGITFCVLGLISIIPIIGFLISIAGLICFIIYWVEISGYSAKLE